MLLRIITGLILAPITLAAIWLADSWILVTFLGLVSAVGSYELTGLASNSIEKSTPSMWQVIGTVLISTGAYTAWVLCTPEWHLPTVTGALILFAMLHMRCTASLENSGSWILWSMVGVIWVSGCLALGASIIHETEPKSAGRAIFITVLLVVWLGDSGAYFVGRFLGKKKLAPILSPNKTMEGAFGGVVASVAGILIAQYLMDIPGSLAILIGFALIGGIVEQAGDLFESLLKRIAGIKDSGNVFPGHGGMLDRIDGLLFAFPLFALFPVLAF
jgi:phosphatidate cytidylyltransferase